MTAPSVICRIAFASDQYAASPSWTDVSADLMELSIHRGRQNEMNRIETGTATVKLLNISGDYWPDNAGGDYSPNVKIRKRINIQATYGGTTYDLFTGFIESWEPGFILEPIKGPVMVLQCADLQKNLSRYQLNNAGYASEKTGVRIGNVLDSLGWPAGDRAIDTGESTLLATGALADTNAMDHIYSVQLAEQGIFYIAGNGNATFKDRYDRPDHHASSVATFGDNPASELPYLNPEYAMEDTLLYNDVRLTRTGGTEQTAEDTDSQTAFGAFTYQDSSMLNSTDAEVEDIAYFIMRNHKDASLRLKSISVQAGVDPTNLFPKVLGYDISTRITVKLTAGSLDKDYHIEGFSHRWTAEKPLEWLTRWELSDAEIAGYPERKTVTLVPDGVGDYNECDQVEPVATPHWQAVQTHLSGNYVRQYAVHTYAKELYSMSDISDTSIYPLSCTIKVWAKEWGSDASDAFRTMLKIGGTIKYGTWKYQYDLLPSWGLFSTTYDLKGYTLAQINAMQAGFEVYESSGIPGSDYVAVDVTYFNNW
jgi:hypothetical protein